MVERELRVPSRPFGSDSFIGKSDHNPILCFERRAGQSSKTAKFPDAPLLAKWQAVRITGPRNQAGVLLALH
jgi:hypothetical protein